jgi:hypothetical protein
MPKFIKVTRSDTGGSYIQTPDEVLGDLEGELLDNLEYEEPGVSVAFTVVEMSQEEYDKLPEFMGW